MKLMKRIGGAACTLRCTLTVYSGHLSPRGRLSARIRMEVKVVKIFIRVLVLERFHASKSVMVRLFLEARAIIQIFLQRAEPATTWTPIALAGTAPSVFI